MTLTKSYARNKGVCATPIYIPGEQYGFYINFDTPINDPGFATFRLDIMKEDQVIMAGIGTLQKDIVVAAVGLDLYNIYCTFTMPIVPPGQYTFAIYDTAAATIKAGSNVILCTYVDPWNATNFLHYRHTYGKFNYGFDRLPSTFFCAFRLAMTQTDLQFPYEKEEYRRLSDRIKMNTVLYRDEVKKLELYYFSDLMHQAITAALMMDQIYINLQRYTVNDAYNIQTDPINNKSKGEVELIEIPGDMLQGVPIQGVLGDLIIDTGDHDTNPNLVFNANN